MASSDWKGKRRQTTAAFFCGLGSMTVGLMVGWPAAAFPKILRHETPYHLSIFNEAFIISCMNIGSIVGTVPASLLMDRIGRRASFLLFSLFAVASWIFVAYAPTVEMLYCGRLLGGVFVGAYLTILPSYLSETLEPDMRGFLGTSSTLLNTLGTLMAYGLGPRVSFIDLSLISCCVAIVFIISLIFMPETPYLLVMRKDYAGARRTLAWLRGTSESDVTDELTTIQNFIETEKAKASLTTSDLFFDERMISFAEIYGRSLNVFSWSKRKLTQIIDLGPEGITPLELRFLHEPTAAEGFVGCGYPGHIFRFFRKDDGSWDAEKVIHIAKKKVIGHAEPEIGGMTLDIVISMDDRFLYTNNWMHGDICQYDITDTRHPKLVGQIFLGGKLLKDGPLKLIDEEQPEPVYVKGRKLDGAPQMMQLSLDGKRLYVSTAVFTPWDKQFYLEHVNNGSTMVRVDVNTETGGLTLDPDFLVDFGKEPNGPILAHEIRYPGGDCTSDIFMKQPA